MAGTLRKLIFVNRYYSPDRSATSQLLTELAEALAQSGAYVAVVTSRQLYDTATAHLPPAELCNGVEVFRVWTTTFGRSSLSGRSLDYVTFYLSSFFLLLRMAHRDDYIIAETDPPLMSVVAAGVVVLRRAHLINWIQDLFPEVAVRLGLGAVARVEPVLRWLRNVSLKRAEANVVLSGGMRNILISEGIPSERIVVISNWSDGKEIIPRSGHANPLRGEWGLGDFFIVAYSGNMGRAHRFGALLDAAAALQGYEGIRFLFVGNGAKRPEIEAEVGARALRNVVFKPFQDRRILGMSLAIADIHVTSLAAPLEGLIVPSKVYGILAAGVPILHMGDPNGEIGAMVTRYDCGCAVSDNDHHAIVAYIKKMYADPVKRVEQGINARRLFDERFDKSCAIASWKKILVSNE